MKPRLLVLSIHPAPYRDPTFYEVLRRGRIGIDVRFFFSLDSGHKEWEWTLPQFPSKNLNLGVPFFNQDKFHLGILQELKKNSCDVVLIPGYSRATSIAALVLSEIKNLPFVLSIDTFHHGKVLSKKGTWRSAARLHFLKHAAAIWVPGKASREYLLSQSVPKRKIFEGAYCFDSKCMVNAFAHAKTRRSETREMLGLSDESFVFLTVGNMIKTRRYLTLAKAFDAVSTGLATDLVMIGSGPDRSSIEALIQSSGRGHIQILNSIPFHELFAYFEASDAYVHPGAESFSTATELAAIAGLPIVATPGVGYVHDLIKRGVQPLLSDIDDIDGLKSNLQTLILNRKYATELGEHTELVAKQRNAQWAAEELENAVFHALNKR